MPRSRDLAALTAILVAPLAAALVLQPPDCPDPGPPPAPLPASAAPLAAPEPAPPDAPLPAPLPAAEPAPTPAEPAQLVVQPVYSALRDPSQFMLMHGTDLVLGSAPDYAWSSGKITVDADEMRLVASRRVKPGRLPDLQRALADANVVVHAADGSTCVAAVGPVRIQLEEEGEVYVGLSEGEGDDADPTQPPVDDEPGLLETAREGLRASGEGVHLVARQRNDAGRACTGVWARRADLPAPAVFGRRELSDDEARALGASVLGLVREQPEFRDLERGYAEYLAQFDEPDLDTPDWNALVADTTVARRWDEVGGPRRILSVEVGPTPEICSGAFGDRFAVFLEQQGDRLVRLPQPGWLDVEALMDLERDGTLEAVSHGDLFIRRQSHSAGPNAAAVTDTFTIPFHGCPC